MGILKLFSVVCILSLNLVISYSAEWRDTSNHGVDIKDLPLGPPLERKVTDDVEQKLHQHVIGSKPLKKSNRKKREVSWVLDRPDGQDAGLVDDIFWDSIKTRVFSSLDELDVLYKKVLSSVVQYSKTHCVVNNSTGKISSKVGTTTANNWWDTEPLQRCPKRCTEASNIVAIAGQRGEDGYPGLDGFPGPKGEGCGFNNDCPKYQVDGLPGIAGLRGLIGFPGLPGDVGDIGDIPSFVVKPYTMDDVRSWVNEEMQNWKQARINMLSRNNCEFYCSKYVSF